MADGWYLRTQDDIFGPETEERILEWAKMGRIQPGQEVSTDGETWIPAVDVPFLDMRWSIDIGDGNPRGPFNKHAAQALLSSGRLPKGSKLVEVREPFEKPQAKPAEEPTRKPVKETAAEPAPSAAAPTVDVDRAVQAAKAAAQAKIEELEREVETLKKGLQAAEKRASEAENRASEARREAKVAVKAADIAEARMASAQEERDRAVAATEEAKAKLDQSIAAEQAAKAEVSAAKANEAKCEDRIQTLSEELKRMPPTAALAADAQAAMFALMREEADDLERALDAETVEMESLRRLHRERQERLQARRQEIMRRIGSDVDDMTRRALKQHPEDPRSVHLRQEMEALRLLQEKSAAESERKIRELSDKLRARDTELTRLRRKDEDSTSLRNQLMEMEERLRIREKELVETRQNIEKERQRFAADQQTLIARLSALELGLPGATNQSREARSVRLAPWMGLKK